MLEIVAADSQAHFQDVRGLLDEYIAWDSELTRQHGVDVQECLDFYYGSGAKPLPGEFSPPEGCLLLATWSGSAAGTGAFRKLTHDSCEMKNIYVRPEYRGKKIGRSLVVALIGRARMAGYRVMKLDTATFMPEAQALYASVGFRPCEPYYALPRSFEEVTVFMELALA